MIKALAGLLGLKSWVTWLIIAGASLSALGGVYAYVDHGGYARAAHEWSTKYDAREAAWLKASIAEAERQSLANQIAKEKEAAALAAERARAAALEAQIAELEKAAEADVNHARVGLGAASVDRLNRSR